MDESSTGADRIRAAIERRGPVESRLATNRGQAAIVRERDRTINRLFASAGGRKGRLLEIGCGDGTTLSRLIRAGLVADGEGIDILPERIDRARATWPQIRFRVADAAALPFETDSFESVLAMTVFSSVPVRERPAIAAEVARVTRPGGVFIWYDMRRPNPSNPDTQPFRAQEVSGLFQGWRVSAHPLTVAPPIARRLGRATDAAYPLLARVGLLLTHEAGVARRPAPP